jgi:hypothetical protein
MPTASGLNQASNASLRQVTLSKNQNALVASVVSYILFIILIVESHFASLPNQQSTVFLFSTFYKLLSQLTRFTLLPTVTCQEVR